MPLILPCLASTRISSSTSRWPGQSYSGRWVSGIVNTRARFSLTLWNHPSVHTVGLRDKNISLCITQAWNLGRPHVQLLQARQSAENVRRWPSSTLLPLTCTILSPAERSGFSSTTSPPAPASPGGSCGRHSASWSGLRWRSGGESSLSASGTRTTFVSRAGERRERADM